VRDNLARAKKAAAEAWKAFTLAAKEAICVTITNDRQQPRRQATRWRRAGTGLGALSAGGDAGLRRGADVG
jgi:hypothetical protein